MTRIVLAIAALAMGLGVAQADGPHEGRFNWTGFYMGVHAGYGSGDWSGHVEHPAPAFAKDPKGKVEPFSGDVDLGSSGWLGGAQIGAQKQYGVWVLGLEADISKTNLEGDAVQRMDYDTDWAMQTRLDWFGTARVRLGYAAGPLLLYATGGLAWGRVEAEMQTISITGPLTMSELSSKSWHVGWAAGAGAEWALTPNVTLRAEYLHVDLGQADYDPKGLAYAGTPGQFKHHELMSGDLTFDVVRGGLNVKF
jgi:outer membrane immunogenic protein